MTIKARKDYFFTTLAVFVSVFILYGCVGTFLQAEIFSGSAFINFILFGGIGGYGFGSILSGIILFSRYISKKRLWFKVVCCCLFPLTIASIVFCGALGFVPYGVYNLIAMLRKRGESETDERSAVREGKL